MTLIASLELPDVQRVFVPVVQFVRLYLLKTLRGIESMNALPALLFSNVGAMTLLGFNAYQSANGLTHRGDDKRTDRPKHGPVSPQCLTQNLSKFTTAHVAAFFNGVIRLLVGVVHPQGDRTVALDGSKVATLLFGWKVLVLIEVRTRLPLAMTVVKIQEDEGCWLVPLVKQARENLGERTRIVKVVIVAKAGMAVREDAHALARDGTGVERVRIVRHGHGHTATTETLTTRLVGIAGPTTYDDYGDPDEVRHRNRADYAGQPINAVVVRTWNNRTDPDGSPVYLTNGAVSDPFAVFDDDDWRTVIENGIFKERKHPWHLTHVRQKTEEAVVVHCFLILIVMALCTALRLWQVPGAPDDGPSGKSPRPGRAQTETVPLAITLLAGEGTARWRRRLQAENRDKVIVFVGEHYGIFHVAEFAVLAGLRIKSVDIPPELGSHTDILARYGLSP